MCRAVLYTRTPPVRFQRLDNRDSNTQELVTIDLLDESYQPLQREIRSLSTQDLIAIEYQRRARQNRLAACGTYTDMDFEFDMYHGKRYGAMWHALLQTRTETADLRYASSDVSSMVGEEEARRLSRETLDGDNALVEPRRLSRDTLDGGDEFVEGNRRSFWGWVRGLARAVRGAHIW